MGSILAITNEHDDDDDGWRAWLSAPASLYGKWFLKNFDEAVHHWSRKRELAADAFSSRVAGVDPAALALLRSAALHELIEEALAHNRDARPEQREGVLPMVRRLVAERGLAGPRDHLEDRQAHPLDTHPSLRQRLEALGVAIEPELIARARDARDAHLLAELGLEEGAVMPATGQPTTDAHRGANAASEEQDRMRSKTSSTVEVPDMAAALEHEFADLSQTARASKIAELEKIDDNGRGSVDIVPQAIILPILAGIFGIMLIQYWLPNPYASIKGITAFSFGVVCVAYGAWALLYPHKPRFTLLIRPTNRFMRRT